MRPAASKAETWAMGKPVALEARAEEREVRGLISITTMRPVCGSWANWTLVPPITPIASTMAWACRSNSFWRAGSMVSIGATQRESPVWVPMGSTFSMKQTVIIWFLASRITSSSNSSQPITDSSTRICPIRLAVIPRLATACNSSVL